MNRLAFLLVSVLLSLAPVFLLEDSAAFAQEVSEKSLLRQARKATRQGDYSVAREKYLELVKRNPEQPVYNYELGVNYYYFTSDQKVQALPYLEKALAGSKPGDTLPELFFLLGETYHLAANYPQALSHYQRFKPYIRSNNEGEELMAEVNRKIAAILQGQSFELVRNDSIIIENLGPNVNTTAPEYVPVISQDESLLMFTSRRPSNVGNKKDFRDEQYFEDMYIARGTSGNFTKAEPFQISDKYVGLVQNSPKHDAVVGLAPDSLTLLSYRDNSLWQSILSPDGTWAGPLKLNEEINDPKAYTPHGVISPDGKELIFSSNRKKGFGDLDLYRSIKQEDGTWGEAENLGPGINTLMSEDAPFFSPDGNTLYFSSRGHTSMGGYDVFRSTRTASGWSAPENLGAPINSPADDIYYTRLNDYVAYYSSNRQDGLGDMDIYRILFKPRPSFDNCVAATNEEYVSPSGIHFSVDVKSLQPSTASILTPDINLPEGFKQHAVFWKQGSNAPEEGERFSFTTAEAGKTDSIFAELVTSNQRGIGEKVCLLYQVSYPDSVIAPVDTVITPVVQDPTYQPVTVYFDLNKAGLQPQSSDKLDQQIALLKANPSVVVKVSGHADSRGASGYNQQLSSRRARVVRDYLVKRGVPAKQIVSAEGKGESMLLNECADGVECTEEQHAINRRATVERVR